MSALRIRIEHLEAAGPTDSGFSGIVGVLGKTRFIRLLALMVRKSVTALNIAQKAELDALISRIAQNPGCYTPTTARFTEEEHGVEWQSLVNRLAMDAPEVREFASGKTWVD